MLDVEDQLKIVGFEKLTPVDRAIKLNENFNMNRQVFEELFQSIENNLVSSSKPNSPRYQLDLSE